MVMVVVVVREGYQNEMTLWWWWLGVTVGARKGISCTAHRPVHLQAKVVHSSRTAHRTEAYPGSGSMKRTVTYLIHCFLNRTLIVA